MHARRATGKILMGTVEQVRRIVLADPEPELVLVRSEIDLVLSESTRFHAEVHRLFAEQNAGDVARWPDDVDVGVGKFSSGVWTCDLTHGYIAINGDYRS